jgi:hypothetical protein
MSKRFRPWVANLGEEFKQLSEEGEKEQVTRLNYLSSFSHNAENRWKENKPAKWMVVIEFFLMGCIAGYYIPIWCGRIANPHERTRIDTIMQTLFPNEISLDNLANNEMILISYDYEETAPLFYSRWFAYKDRKLGKKGKTTINIG